MAERIHCLCVGCCVTWGPPVTGPCNRASCVSMVVSLVDWLTQKNNNNNKQHRTTQRTVEFMWFGLKPTSTGDQWIVYLFERIGGKEDEDYTLGSLLLSSYKKKKRRQKCNA